MVTAAGLIAPATLSTTKIRSPGAMPEGTVLRFNARIKRGDHLGCYTATGGCLRTMNEIALQLEYSVVADVSFVFAWQFRADVSNWNDPPAQFALAGPFEEGSRGTTLLPGQAPLHWQICNVVHGASFVVEMHLDCPWLQR
jgi:hypothetical protein